MLISILLDKASTFSINYSKIKQNHKSNVKFTRKNKLQIKLGRLKAFAILRYIRGDKYEF